MTILADKNDYLTYSNARLEAVVSVIELTSVHMKSPVAHAARCERLIKHLQGIRSEQLRRESGGSQCISGLRGNLASRSGLPHETGQAG